MSVVKYKGVSFSFGDKTLVIPPLNLRALEQMQEKIAGFTGQVNAEQVGIVADVTLAALQRNYPEMTRDEVADIIDLGNMMDVMNAVMGVSGLAEKGEALEANQ
jgi:hypothetical protein